MEALTVCWGAMGHKKGWQYSSSSSFVYKCYQRPEVIRWVGTASVKDQSPRITHQNRRILSGKTFKSKKKTIILKKFKEKLCTMVWNRCFVTLSFSTDMIFLLLHYIDNVTLQIVLIYGRNRSILFYSWASQVFINLWPVPANVKFIFQCELNWSLILWWMQG